MHENDTCHFNLETPAAGATVPCGRNRLRGWLVPKPAFHYSDVRARVGSRWFRGVHGHPRADLAAFFRLGRPHALAGFTIDVTLEPGPAVIQLEALDGSGRWQPFHTCALQVTTERSTVAGPDPLPLRAHEFADALGLWLRDAQPATAADRLAAEVPWPRMLQDAPHPFHGHFDEPPALARANFGQVQMHGWLFHETQRIRRVLATTDLIGLAALERGGTFARVHERFPQFAHARDCRLTGFVPAPAQLPHPLSVRVYAELEDGSWHLALAWLFRPIGTEELKADLPAFSLPRLWRGWRELRRAWRDRGVPVESGAELRRRLLALARDYRHFAPPASRPGLPAPALASAGPLPPRLVLVTHNLNYEGAPLWLLELARHLRKAGDLRLLLLSPEEGRLRAAFESIGVEVRLVDGSAIQQAPSAGAIRRTVRRWARGIDWTDTPLVIANTVVGFWGVALAHAAGRKALLYIHESTSPAAFFRRGWGRGVLPSVRSALRSAELVSFIAGPAAAYYARLVSPARIRVTPGWIDLAGIDAHIAAHPRDAVRARLGLAPDTRLVVNVGTVCDRKGQHVFVAAVEHLWRRHPELARRCRFLLIGARDDAYNAALRALVAELGRPNLELVGETGAAYDFFHAADCFACTSYEEAFPRVVLEAMAFRLPIIASAVHGIPDMVRAEEEAILVPPGDTEALLSGLVRFLGACDEARRWGERARARVERDFRQDIVMPRHLALVSGLAASGASTHRAAD